MSPGFGNHGMAITSDDGQDVKQNVEASETSASHPEITEAQAKRILLKTDLVIVPHIDNADFGEGCRRAGNLCDADGYRVRRLTDAQALLIDGATVRLVGP